MKEILSGEVVQVLQIVNQVDNLRINMQDGIEKGFEPSLAMLEVVERSASIVEQKLDKSFRMMSWRKLCEGQQGRKELLAICEMIGDWAKDVLEYIQEMIPKGQVCNICRDTVLYMPMDKRYREEQKQRSFPYWDAVFESQGRKKCICSNCESLDYERMISLFVDMLKPVDGNKLKVLHIAPTKVLNAWFAQQENAMDYNVVEMGAEVEFGTRIPIFSKVSDETYDVILCSQALECAEDDRSVMQEIKRIMKADGVCLFMVPLVIGLKYTDEETRLSDEESLGRFGDENCKRVYAKEDFLNRLTEAGFMVHLLGQDYFGQEQWNANGLSDIHCLYAATKEDIGIGVPPYRKVVRKEELVSVIVPTYNRGYCIERSVRSVLEQTHKNIEVIIVDDASTDNTEEIVRGIGDGRIRYVKLEKNRGANHARNVGIEFATGDYIAFNDSDDEWLPEKLEKQMHLMQEPGNENVGCVYCILSRYNGEELDSIAPNLEQQGEDLIGDIYQYMLENMFISTQTVLIQREVFCSVGYFNEDLMRLQDWELLLRIAARYRFTLVQESLVKAYIQKSSISSNTAGYIDTILYVIRLHDVKNKYGRIYKHLMDHLADMIGQMLQYEVSDEYKEKLIRQIEENGFCGAEAIAYFRSILSAND